MLSPDVFYRDEIRRFLADSTIEFSKNTYKYTNHRSYCQEFSSRVIRQIISSNFSILLSTSSKDRVFIPLVRIYSSKTAYPDCNDERNFFQF